MPYFTPEMPHEQPAHHVPPTPLVFEPVDTPPARWEYHVIAIDPREDEPLDEQALSGLGSDGWLLISVLPLRASDLSTHLYYYFVRQV